MAADGANMRVPPLNLPPRPPLEIDEVNSDVFHTPYTMATTRSITTVAMEGYVSPFIDSEPETDRNVAAAPPPTHATEWYYADAPAKVRCSLFTCKGKVSVHKSSNGWQWHGSVNEDNENDLLTLQFHMEIGRNKCCDVINRTLHRHPVRRNEYWAREGVCMWKKDTWIWLVDEMRWMSLQVEHCIETLQ